MRGRPPKFCTEEERKAKEEKRRAHKREYKRKWMAERRAEAKQKAEPKQYVYMLVSKDEYQLPMAMADSAAELAEMTGTPLNTVRSTICKEKQGKLKRPRFVRVEIDDE